VKIKFLADASLNHAIVSGVIRVEPSIDFASANSIGLEGVDDDEVLAIAAREGRIIVTHDLTDNAFSFREVLEPVGESRGPSGVAIDSRDRCY
jgi:predicted nuclease of predicted toxin-antitoxin system